MEGEIHENQEAQRRIWVAERIGWAALFLLVAMAAAGAFGDGPLSHARTEAGNGGTIRYERILRRSAPSEIQIDVSHPRPGEDIVLLVSQDLARILDLDRSIPAPARIVALEDGGLALVFAMAPGASDASLLLHLEPKNPGPLSSKISVEGGPPMVLKQRVLP